jgi:hypothetical protein
MKTFPEFCKEAYDASFMSGAQVRQSGEGGRVGRVRKKTPAEMRRMSQETDAQGNRKPIQVKDRKDIGTQKQADTRVQQPEQERGSAAVRERAAAAAKEERRKLAKERAAAKSGGETPKPKSSDLIKQATKILSKTKPAEVDKRPKDQPKRPVVGMSREKRKDITRRGGRKLRDLVIQHRAEKQGVDPSKIKLTPDYDIK